MSKTARTKSNEENEYMKFLAHDTQCPVCKFSIINKNYCVVAQRILASEFNSDFFGIPVNYLLKKPNKIVVCGLECEWKVKKSWWWNDPEASNEKKALRLEACKKLILELRK